MKRIIIPLVLALASIVGTGQSQPDRTITIMTHNLWFGGDWEQLFDATEENLMSIISGCINIFI